MAVYVDKPIHRLGRMIMCHMIADTIEELHQMADAIGVDRRHFQSKASFPHYDICKSKRSEALKRGATYCDRHEFVGVMRLIRNRRMESE